MYVVIFRATIAELDTEYDVMAVRLRDRALTEFGCVNFVALTQGDQEIALSYWNSLEDIARWRDDAEHRQAQALGRQKWYKTVQVEIAKVERHTTPF